MSKETPYQKQQREHGMALKKQQQTGKPAMYGGQADRSARQIQELQEQNAALLKVVLEHEERMDQLEMLLLQLTENM